MDTATGKVYPHAERLRLASDKPERQKHKRPTDTHLPLGSHQVNEVARAEHTGERRYNWGDEHLASGHSQNQQGEEVHPVLERYYQV